MYLQSVILSVFFSNYFSRLVIIGEPPDLVIDGGEEDAEQRTEEVEKGEGDVFDGGDTEDP